MRRTARSIAVAGAYVACWAYVSTHGNVLPGLNGTAEIWAFALFVIALHVAIGYVIGSMWVVALALTPALMLIPAGRGEWAHVVAWAYVWSPGGDDLPTVSTTTGMWTVAEGVPIAAFITVGVLLKRHRETRFHTL